LSLIIGDCCICLFINDDYSQIESSRSVEDKPAKSEPHKGTKKRCVSRGSKERDIKGSVQMLHWICRAVVDRSTHARPLDSTGYLGRDWPRTNRRQRPKTIDSALRLHHRDSLLLANGKGGSKQQCLERGNRKGELNCVGSSCCFGARGSTVCILSSKKKDVCMTSRSFP
jgi:hypothetical protein